MKLDGIDAYTVTSGGIQSLTVSPDNPLNLYNLDLSLEWDASQDTRYQEQLKYDLQRVSELLYDWSNGQAALGQVRVFHNRQMWNEAHLRIYASNRLRPNADLGGIVSEVITETVTTPGGATNTLTYQPGQVRMGASWNRYGDEYGTLGEDWPRTLAHELSHYLFYLDDNYLGLDQDGLVFPVYSCPSAMADPYRDDDITGFDEYHLTEGWDANCADTLSNQITRRSDWETIQNFYPELNAVGNVGPNSLPLAVTNVEFQPITSSPLEVPVFNLVNAAGERYLASNRSRAFLIQPDHLIDLGRPSLDRVQALGASVGDVLCVYDEPNQSQGCAPINAGSEQLTIRATNGWKPEIVVTPVTTDTFQVEISSLAGGLNLTTRLYSADDPPSALQIPGNSNGVYTTTFTDLPYPVVDGFIFLQDTGSGNSYISAFTIGGSPARIYSRGARIRSRGARIRSRGAPLISGDGQVILYVDDLTFPEDEYYTFQTVSNLPTPPTWATPVGLAYRLTASPGAPVLSGASISLSYLEADVPDGEESWLKIYYYNGAIWQPLETRLEPDENLAIAISQGTGIYALMSSFRIELHNEGWNLFAYPINQDRAVAEALSSIQGKYTLVYGFERINQVDHWQVFAPGMPDWLGTVIEQLTHLKFGRGYWIHATEATTLYLKGAQADMLGMDSFGGYPPATYYGPVQSGSGFTPAPGMPVVARTGSVVCGQGETLDVNGQIVYAVQVQAEGFSTGSGCGVPGRTVTFTIDGQAMEPFPAWDNTQLWEVPLKPASQIFIPFVTNKFISRCDENLVKDQIWFGNLTVSCDAAQTPTGTNSLRMQAVNYSNVEVYSQLISVQPNQTYKVSYWIKTNLENDPFNPPGVTGKVIAAQYNAYAAESDTLIQNRIDAGFTLGTNLFGNNDWVYREYIFTTTSSTAFIRLRGVLGGYGGYSRGTVWLDNVKIEKVP